MLYPNVLLYSSARLRLGHVRCRLHLACGHYPSRYSTLPLSRGQAGMCMASAAIDRAKEPSNLEIGLRCLLCQSWDVCRGTAYQTRCSVLCVAPSQPKYKGHYTIAPSVVESNTSGPFMLAAHGHSFGGTYVHGLVQLLHNSTFILCLSLPAPLFDRETHYQYRR